MKTGKWWLLGISTTAAVGFVIAAIVVFWTDSKGKLESRNAGKKESFATARAAETVKAEQIQIHPNYEFSEGVNRIKIPLIPSRYVLPREAGGWVTAPLGSRIRIDYEVPVVIENIDGRKFHREPGKPAWDGVEPGNGIFRLYGQEGKYAIVAIKRGVY